MSSSKCLVHAAASQLSAGVGLSYFWLPMASPADDITVDPDTITLRQDFSTLDRGFTPELFDDIDRDVPMSSVNGDGVPAQLFSPEQQAWLESWLASRASGAPITPTSSSQAPPQSGKYKQGY